MQKAADTNQLVELERHTPVKAVFQFATGHVGGFCDAQDVRAGLADCEAYSSGDTDFGVQPVHIDRLHTVVGRCKPLATFFRSISTVGIPKLGCMSSEQPLISRIAGDVLTGLYSKKRLTQPELAALSGIPLPTLQKKLKGKAPVTATDLVVLAQAMGVDPVDVMAEIVRDTEAAQRLTSEGVASLSEHRRKKSPAEMTDDELDAIQKKAAVDDDELEQPEPDAP